MLDERFEQARRAEVVGADIAPDFVHRLADADLGGEMDDTIDIPQRLLEATWFADVTGDELDFRFNLGRPAFVYLFDQRVDHGNLIAISKKFVNDVPADEPATAGDKNLVHGYSALA
jgi:hypothetical protein